jgi:hypothetical protein
MNTLILTLTTRLFESLRGKDGTNENNGNAANNNKSGGGNGNNHRRQFLQQAHDVVPPTASTTTTAPAAAAAVTTATTTTASGSLVCHSRHKSIPPHERRITMGLACSLISIYVGMLVLQCSS